MIGLGATFYQVEAEVLRGWGPTTDIVVAAVQRSRNQRE